jgi:hypothetical protein
VHEGQEGRHEQGQDQGRGNHPLATVEVTEPMPGRRDRLRRGGLVPDFGRTLTLDYSFVPVARRLP